MVVVNGVGGARRGSKKFDHCLLFLFSFFELGLVIIAVT